MSEIVNVFDLKNPFISQTMDRNGFYKEQISYYKENWVAQKAVEVVNIFLFNESWELILQKRSSHKGHNANLIDKSIGGHIVNWDNADFTAMIESVQELKVPSIVLNTHQDFLKTYLLLNTYLSSTAIIEHIDTKITTNSKIINWEEIVIANKTHFYIWVYWWSVKNVDKEAKGILFYSLEELKEELEAFPDTFTQDMHYYMKDYTNYFESFLAIIKSKGEEK